MPLIAVTGGGGFVGRHFREAALRAGVRVQPLPRALLAGPGLADAMAGADAVVHLAARLPGDGRHGADPEAAFQADNVELTARVAQACLDASVTRFVFMSSAGVLGQCSPPEGFDDHTEPAPHDAYTRSKLAAEELLMRRFSARLEIAIIRPPLVYGPGCTGSFRRIHQLALSGWPLPLAAIDAPRSLISVRNLADLLLATVRTGQAGGLRMLAADAEVIGLAGLVRAIARAAGGRARIVAVPTGALFLGMRLLGRGEDYRRLAQPLVVRGSAAALRLGWVPPFRQADEIDWTVAAWSSAGLRA